MTDAPAERTTYGNWIQQRSPGLFGAGLLGTVALFGGVILALFVLLTAGTGPAVVVAIFAGIVFTAVGTPVGHVVARRVGYTYAKIRKRHLWRSGVLSWQSSRPARNRLPGTLGGAELLTASTFAGDAAVVKASGGLYSVVVRCAAEGPAMQDQGRVDAWVAGYASLLSACGQEAGLVCVKAITDTAPDPGGQLAAMVDTLRSPAGPQLAREVMSECVDQLPAASSENVTYLELTYRGRLLSRKGDDAAILGELGRKVPGLLALAQSAGGGSVETLTAPELSRLVRVAYDPSVAPALEAAELAGDVEPVDWTDAGPVAYRDLWADFVHDSARSITWEMHRAPTSKITEKALAGLLMPHGDFARKRVALIYRPHSADESTTVAERDANTANFVAQQGRKRPSASAQLVQRAAEQSRQEVAAGAASVRFSLLVTATVALDGDLAQAVTTLESKARAVPIRLRRCYGAQASGFAATLPVGFVPHLHTAVPASVREWL